MLSHVSSSSMKKEYLVQILDKIYNNNNHLSRHIGNLTLLV